MKFSKKALLGLISVLALAAFAMPAMASAAQWTVNGSPIAGDVAVNSGGTIATYLPGTGTTISCDVSDAGVLSTGGGGSITSFSIDTPSCVVTNPPSGCTLSATSADTSTPWGLSLTSLTGVSISGISFSNTFVGASCALNGVPVTATGSVSGTFNGADQEVDLSGAGPLTTNPNVGPAYLSGFDAMCVDDGSGGCTSDVIGTA